jgi:hypothetical protein
MKERFAQIGAMLAGAAIIGTALSVHPVAAKGTQQLRSNLSKTCSSSNPCSKETNKGSGAGFEGLNIGTGDGVDGLSDNNNGVGAVTYNPSSTNGGRSGLFGVDGSTDGGGGNVAVTGLSTNGTGVRGQSTNGLGVAAWSDSYPALQAISYSKATAIWAIGGTSADAGGYSLATYQANNTAAFWVSNDSNAHVNGLIYTHGGCSNGCSRSRGESVVSYAAQTSAPILEDVGEGRLVNGQAKVTIDAALARAIDRGAPYVVFVTPEGPSRSLYVTNKTPFGFAVAENDGGRSNIAFGYRIVAKPYGVNAARLPVVTAAQVPHMKAPQKR